MRDPNLILPGYGTIGGRLMFVFSQDFTVFGGSLSEPHGEKICHGERICKVMDRAVKTSAPVIGRNDSGAARIPFVAARRGFIDDIIMPRDTRAQVCRALSMLWGKRLENPWKKHGNMPL